MSPEFRQRVLIPIALPTVTLLVILFVAFSLSQVFLAVSKLTAAAIGALLAGYVLLVGFLIERRPRISSRALAVGLTLGVLAMGGAGVAGAVAGPREIVEAGEEGAVESDTDPLDDAQQGNAPAEDVADIPEDAAVWVAGNEIAWEEVPEGPLPAGEITVGLQLTGGLPHNVVFEGIQGDQPIVEGAAEGVYFGTVNLEPGEYVYYCSIPGHETAMRGTITVE